MTPLSGLPDELKPSSVEDALAIQDEVSHQLGRLIGGFKAMAPVNGDPTRGIIYGGTIHASPCELPASTVPQCGVEGEVAFIFRRDLPYRAKPYSRNEVASVIDACAAIEVVHSRFAQKAPVSDLDKLAGNSISNGALVHDVPRSDWRDLRLGQLKVTLSVNGKSRLDQIGGHPTGDPLGVAVVLANIWREKGGVRAGQFVTCGSCTGLKVPQSRRRMLCPVRRSGSGRESPSPKHEIVTTRANHVARPPSAATPWSSGVAPNRWMYAHSKAVPPAPRRRKTDARSMPTAARVYGIET